MILPENAILMKPEDNGIVYFTWRDTPAQYDSRSKEFKFFASALEVIPWDKHPKDMVVFFHWLLNCTRHQCGIRFKKYGDDEFKEVGLYSIEFY